MMAQVVCRLPPQAKSKTMSTKVYAVFKNADTCEGRGRGPMVLDSVWSDLAKANTYIDSQPGVMGRMCKWSEQKYGDWYVSEMNLR